MGPPGRPHANPERSRHGLDPGQDRAGRSARRERADSIQIELPLGPPALLARGDLRPELLVETKSLFRQALFGVGPRERLQRLPGFVQTRAELSLQVLLDARGFDRMTL